MHGNQIFIHNFASEKNKEWLSPIVLRYHFLRGRSCIIQTYALPFRIISTGVQSRGGNSFSHKPVTRTLSQYRFRLHKIIYDENI